MLRTNLAVCFAFEEREQDAHEKARDDLRIPLRVGFGNLSPYYTDFIGCPSFCLAIPCGRLYEASVRCVEERLPFSLQ